MFESGSMVTSCRDNISFMSIDSNKMFCTCPFLVDIRVSKIRRVLPDDGITTNPNLTQLIAVVHFNEFITYENSIPLKAVSKILYQVGDYTVEPGYNDIDLCETASIASDIPWHELIPRYFYHYRPFFIIYNLTNDCAVVSNTIIMNNMEHVIHIYFV